LNETTTMKNSIKNYILIIFLYGCGQNPNAITKTDSNHVAKNMDTLFYENHTSSVLEESTTTYTKVCTPFRLGAYLNDPDTTGTNIRKSPAGKIRIRLKKDDANFEHYFILTNVEDRWFKIESPIKGVENNIELSNHDAWIHGSVLSVDTRNYAGEHINLLDNPENGKINRVFKEEIIGLKLIDVCGAWVQVEFELTIGWIESKWLCGNPLTNCS
jgi:hypothetical protein